MTLVWLSSGLPADRSELAAALPSAFSLVPPNPAADPNTPADVGVLPVGSLCVATVFETALLAQLADRPAGVGLLVIGPTAAAGVTAASSVPELAAAIQHAANAPAAAPEFPTAPLPFAPGLAEPVTPLSAETPAAPEERTKTPLRTRLIAAGAVALGLAIGGVVIGTTEGTSSATSARGGGFGNFGGQLPGVNFLAALELPVLEVRPVLAVRPVLVVRAPPSARPRPGKSWPASAGRGSRFRPTNCSRTPVIPSCSRPSSPASSSCAVAPPAQSQVGHSPVTERPPNLMA